MALSPSFPPNLFTPSLSLSASYPSLSLLILQTRTQSSNCYRNLKLETSCYQTIRVESEVPQKTKVTSKTPKKKRKLRPSFYEQVRDRWSLKNHSQRLKFPWQEQEEQEQEQEQEQEEKEENQQLSPTFNSLEEKEVNFDLGNRVISAPWVHRSKPREPHFKSETKITKNSCIDGEEVSERKENLKNSKRVVNNSNRSSEENEFLGSIVNIDASQIGLAEEKLMDFGDDFNDIISLDEYSSRSDENVDTFVGSSGSNDSVKLPWEKKSTIESVDGHKWRRNKTELAEKLVPELELRRLRNVALRMKERIKVGAAGITQALLDCIHDKWKVDEVVKLKFEGPPALNMQRTHDVLESKTGGLVIWRSGSSIVLFRGMSYKLSCVQSYTKQSQANLNTNTPLKDSASDVIRSVGVSDSVRATSASGTSSVKSPKDPSEEELVDISDLNNLLDELGPRFIDWSGRDPQPVDADLLPSLDPGYTPPFRLLPHGIRHCLGNKEMTSYRRLARTVPPHFALGRNRELQGLAMAMVKLWERSAIAKIAIKRGVQNTCNERMAEEIKNLTGGTLLSRNKDFIVFYRGNDFLSPAVTDALVEREKLAELRQDEEELARQRASSLIVSNSKVSKVPLVAGTLAETLAANSRWANQPSSEEMKKMKRDLALAKHASLVRYLEKKLAQAQEKVKKAERALGKVQEFLKPTDLPTDLETITDEERFLFRKIGLSMTPFLLLGKRGVFDGTVENMHLHWKYRELVKIIVKGKSFPQVKHIAISLEAESGGLLISVDKTTKGYVIIVYRGKNYQRPHAIRPKNLLTRRQALARSIELQRREALNHHILSLRERIEMLKSQLDQMDDLKETGDDDLYSKLKDAYSSNDDIEDEGEEAYLETYNSGDEKQNIDTEEAYLKYD
ncbi:RNA-binding [Macleaya cordata]|uniref:RNA-binding n=1 Tax=Macleaya cordata TaxID=56857 RepID=A0A200Q5X1_MACCD|nr:RNA-binding [Macleaya cordata]